mgnify:CR=1 FL=1
MGNRFDVAYRNFLHSYYHREGFDATRLYVDLFSGGSYSTTPCFYCGLQATCEDHSYPLVALSQLLAEGQPPAKRRLTIVPSCHECNALLGDKLFPNQSARKRFVSNTIQPLRSGWMELSRSPLGSPLQEEWTQGPRGRLTCSPNIRIFCAPLKSASPCQRQVGLVQANRLPWRSPICRQRWHICEV